MARFAGFAAALCLAVAVLGLGGGRALAARPLLDSGKWDAYFGLFARDTQVPWKRIGVRLDTYSGAPVELAAYAVDPADVLVAGSNARPRAIDTTHRSPVVHWRFTPPAGLKFESNDVEVPLRNREGFFVVEARRGAASQQVWLNVSRIGVLTKESPGGIVLYAADLGSGHALGGMRLTYLVGSSFAYGKTGADGIAHVAGLRPRFALAEWGASRAFINFVPVPPSPAAVVAVRLDRGSVRAGEVVHAVGFARSVRSGELRPARGSVKVTVVARGRVVAAAAPPLDGVGAFSAEIALPADLASGDVAVLAAAAGATGGAALHVEALGDAAIAIVAPCGGACPPSAPVPIALTIRKDGVPQAGRDLHVRVVRTPHVVAPGTPEGAVQWATTVVLDAAVRSDALGAATVTLPPPGDGLASTYGISVQSGTSSASARLVTPTAKIAIAVAPERSTINIGQAAVVDVRGFDAFDGTPDGGREVRVQLIHGPNVQETRLRLDATGRGRATFRDVPPGTSLVTGSAEVDGRRAFDASAVAVEPSAVTAGGGGVSGEVHIDFDRSRYPVATRASITGTLAGAVGDAFISVDGVRSFGAAVVPVRGGRAAGSVSVPAALGDVEVGVAFVRDGALYYGSRQLAIDGPGHPRLTALHADREAYAPGETAKLAVDDGRPHDDATIALRLGDGIPAQSADFIDAPQSLAAAGTTSQNSAADDPGWHAWVAPARSTAGDIFSFDRPRVAERTTAMLAVAAPRALVWRVDEHAGHTLDVTLPQEKGTYVLSILKLTADGDAGAASLTLTVQ